MGGAESPTLTFLFTDIEGSTRLVRELGDRYPELLDRHRELVEQAAAAHGGRTFGAEGDALFLEFENAIAAVRAAADAQRAIADHHWPDGRRLGVRMGINTGVVTRVRDDYVGLVLHEVARITAAGHGGQVLLSAAAAGLVRDALGPAGLELRDLGEHQLKDLARPERLFQLVGEGLADAFGPLRALKVRLGNLPVQLTSFVGRAEIVSAAALLAASRLLTLTGPGGTGKTRLALELASASGGDFPDGTFFVGLDSVTDPELVTPAILAALDVPDRGQAPLDQLAEHVRERRMLLVLDNFEQVVEAGPLVAWLLRESRELKVVVTSRIPLRVSGEQELAVPPLGLPDPGIVGTAAEASQFEAVRLFVERSSAANAAFRLTDANAAAVVDIVRRLDGLPLAIELAAARTRVIPVETLRARLDRALGVLVGGPRDVPARQQTLRGAIDWSHELLDLPDRRLFARFSVVAGGGRLSEADAICGPKAELGRDVLDGLTSLAEMSLVRSSLSVDEEPRFEMLMTIREYAAERLAELPDDEEARIRRRHAAAYLAVAESCAGRLSGPEGRHWLDRLEADHDNLRAAIDWSVGLDEAELAMRLFVALWRFWQFRGHLVEASLRAWSILALPGVAKQPLELQARAFGAAGSIAYWRGDAPTAHANYRVALDRARRSGDLAVEAEALYNIGFVPIPNPESQDEAMRAGRPWFEAALARYGELADRAGVAGATWGVALSAGADGDVATASAAARKSGAAYRELGDPFGLGWALHLAGAIDIHRGDFDQAESALREGLSIFVENGDLTGILFLVGDFAMLARARGRHDRMWRLFGVVERIRSESGIDLAGATMASVEFRMPELPPDDPDDLRAFEAGQRLSTDEAVALALGS